MTKLVTSLALALAAANGAQAGTPRFQETAEAAGISYMHERAEFDPSVQKIMPWLTAGGAGVAVGDYDNDGLDDIYVVTSLHDRPNELYRNLGDFRFKPMAAELGLADVNDRTVGTSAHAVWFDYDADGWNDLLLMRFGQLSLFRNHEGERFVDVAKDVGLDLWANALSAVAFDYDNDGDLDLYLGGYFPEKDFYNLSDTKVLFESWESAVNGGPNYLFQNDGTGQFTDVTDETGTQDFGWAMAVGHGDLNNDGLQDLYIANDFGGDTLLMNTGDAFDNKTREIIGVDTKKGMNVDIADYNNDGFLDIYVTNMTEPYLHECNMLWENAGGEALVDVSTETGSCDTDWGWGAKFFDADNDGQLDIFAATGFISDGEEDYMKKLLDFIFEEGVDLRDATEWPDMAGYSMAGYEPNYLLHQQFGVFSSIGPEAGVDHTGDARGVSIADFDRDGLMDFVVTNVQGPLLVYRNVTEDAENWAGFRLVGDGLNPTAVGARVTLAAGIDTQIREVNIGNGFNSASTTDVHFGIGAADSIDTLEVRWPDGTAETFASPPVNGWYLLEKGSGTGAPLTVAELPNQAVADPEKPTPPWAQFTDWTAAAGIDKPHLTPVFDDELAHIMDMVSAGAAGAAVGDYDDDGDLDLFTNSARSGTANQLWRNDGDLRFTDVAAAAGVADLNSSDSVSSGGIFFDYDGDGDRDLLVLQLGISRLMRNDGDGTFTDVTEAAGLADYYRNTLAAVVFDADRDGDLDMYYGVYFRDVNMFDLKAGESKEIMHDSWESSLNAGSNLFFRNEGDGTFTEATAEVGLSDTGWTMAVGHGDMDNDGWQDVYVANDYGADRVFMNRSGVFEDISRQAIGVDTRKGMNADLADFDGDGFLDIYVTNVTEDFLHECNMLWRNAGDGTFLDISQEMNVCDGGWAWGAKFFDYDNDADVDLYVANGFFTSGQGDYLDVLLPALWNNGGENPADAALWPDIGGMSMASMEPNAFFVNEAGLTFRRIEDSPLVVNSDSRGVFTDDFDQDGRVDIFVTNNAALPMLFRNEVETDGAWLLVELAGSPPNTDAVGARVTAEAAGLEQIREVNLGNGFAGSSSSRLHFGFGPSKPTRLTIAWPDGVEQTIENPQVNRLLTISHPRMAQQTSENEAK